MPRPGGFARSVPALPRSPVACEGAHRQPWRDPPVSGHREAQEPASVSAWVMAWEPESASVWESVSALALAWESVSALEPARDLAPGRVWASVWVSASASARVEEREAQAT